MGKHAFWTASFQCLAKSLLATASLENEFHLQFPCGSHSTELSDFRQLAQRGNKRECEQTLKNTCKSNELLTRCNLRQSAFHINFFNAAIHIAGMNM